MQCTRHAGGPALLEYAIVPFVFFIILALVVGGLAVFRYQEVPISLGSDALLRPMAAIII